LNPFFPVDKLQNVFFTYQSILNLNSPQNNSVRFSACSAERVPNRYARASAILLLLTLCLFLSGCKTWDLNSFRSFASVVSYAAPTTVQVTENKRIQFNERAKALVGVVPKPEKRTLEFLTRNGLDKLWEKEPKTAILRVAQLSQQQHNLEPVFALANLKFVYAEKMRMQGNQSEALSQYGGTVVIAYRFLFDPKYDVFRNAYDPNFRGICDHYNHALEEMMRLIKKSNQIQPNFEYTLQSESGTIEFSILPAGRWAQESLSDLEFVSDYEAKGLTNSYRTFGLGVPLIATWETTKTNSLAKEHYPPAIKVPLTAFMQVNTSDVNSTDLKCTLHLLDPLEQTNVKINERIAPLESDVTTPLALFLQDPLLNVNLLGVFSMLNGKIADEVRGLYMLEPYDENKIPVLLVHGLASSPMTWTEMFNDLRSDPYIQKNYQFWFYMYPTGQPFWASARQMREDLKNVRHQLDPEGNVRVLDEMVCVGHSMGALISRMQTIYSDDLFWNLVSDRKPGDLKGDEEARRELLGALYFEPNPSIRRVVTIASPNRGSNFANDTTIWLSHSFFKLPDWMSNESKQIIKSNPDFFRDTKLLKISTSIDSLSPENPIFETLGQARKAPWVRYHNIYGRLTKPHPFSLLTKKVIGEGDGVVPVESATAIDAESELEVEHGHITVHENTEAILEV